MIHEIVIQHVAPEKRDEYIKVFGDILLKNNYPGSHAIKFFTSIEDPSRVILMIEWDNVEAHTQIRGTPPYNAMRELTARYQTTKSDHAHFVVHEVKSWFSELDKGKPVSLEELMVSTLAMTDALAKLLIEKGVILDAEFKHKLLEGRAGYQSILNPTTQ